MGDLGDLFDQAALDNAMFGDWAPDDDDAQLSLGAQLPFSQHIAGQGHMQLSQGMRGFFQQPDGSSRILENGKLAAPSTKATDP